MYHRNLQLARTDYVSRQHIYIDVNARRIDCFEVELLAHGCAPIHGDTPEQLWQRVQATVAALRGQYEARPLYPLTVLQPFCVIKCLDLERETAAGRLQVAMLAAYPQSAEVEERFRADVPEAHGMCVADLCEAHDLLRFLDGQRPASPVSRQ
jgi:hypothetical protein